ncbi:nuclear transport factor 2 family protein [Pseudoflavitalea sp. G-6-1-2]|uniref:nuclear transport factor 2 family protein n=1 Tax=Pseudoflavitalea sp. G-6-1-2 TaxID=2728841 RepID=UPI00146DC9ED|nr:nuclear transport factor 2 family protein [Pseudoflavitalea sp. G-6-1-2]NML20989.1 nuclear transport factor 2 family protein [Pseudoflavitalea sp. G-6-1-2]
MAASLNIVQQFMNALNNEDWAKAEALLTPDFKFAGVMGSREGASNYMEDMSRMKIKYNIHQVFENGNDVAVLCDYDMNGQSIFGCSWYQLRGDKINLLRVVFDPRPLLDKKPAH